MLKGRAPALPPSFKKPRPSSATLPGGQKDATSLRPLFWTTFAPPVDRACVWDDVDISVTGVGEVVRKAEERLVALFPYNQRKEVAAVPKENLKPATATAAPSSLILNGKRLMKVLDDKKTQNLAIALRKFPEPEAVMDAIVSVDIDKLTGDQVALLLQEFPSPDVCAEIERVENSHTEEEDHLFEWDRPEQYLLVLACIYNCKNILTVWSFAVNQHTRSDGPQTDSTHMDGTNVKLQLTEFIAACDAVCNSTALRVFLATIREVGNRMNQNTPRGNARGVAVESLLQFDDLRSAGAGSVTLFSVVVDVWCQKNPDNLNDLLTQLARVKKLRIPSIQEIEIEINKQLELSKRAANSLQLYYQELEDEASVQIADKLKNLADPVSKQIKANAELLAKAKASWAKCISYFCIKGDSVLGKNSNEFFDHWKKVVKLVEKYCPDR